MDSWPCGVRATSRSSGFCMMPRAHRWNLAGPMWAGSTSAHRVSSSMRGAMVASSAACATVSVIGLTDLPGDVVGAVPVRPLVTFGQHADERVIHLELVVALFTLRHCRLPWVRCGAGNPDACGGPSPARPR